ncbi:hypothetical protein QR98_0069180 [Sarcoptes scabiei]|uniref:Uncharacterized protein n=1 Tax=Sarcoptes scabiei TaxID=52283 RepID=A0A132ABN3_SARSC|nr:hypothetical protein QR98_0069180 [Sarcoptes scabiei]
MAAVVVVAVVNNGPVRTVAGLTEALLELRTLAADDGRDEDDAGSIWHMIEDDNDVKDSVGEQVVGKLDNVVVIEFEPALKTGIDD